MYDMNYIDEWNVLFPKYDLIKLLKFFEASIYNEFFLYNTLDANL